MKAMTAERDGMQMGERDDPAIRLLKHRRQDAVWLAHKTGIDAERIRRIGRRERGATWTRLERIAVARAFDAPVDVLFPGHGEDGEFADLAEAAS